MASIPTYLYFGDDQISGGASPPGFTASPTDSIPRPWAQWLNNPKFSRFVPSGPTGTTGGTFSPYWDGRANSGAGGFVTYTYWGIPSSDLHGDNWYSVDHPSGGITPCTMLMNSLWEKHPGGFKLLKYGVSGAGFGTGAKQWKSGGTAYNEAKTHWTNMLAAMTTAGDTPDLRAVIIDATATDIVNENPTYSTDIQSFITAFRADYSSTALVMLVSHRYDFAPAQGTAALAARQLNQTIAAVNTNVAVFDMAWASFGTDGPDGGTAAGPLYTVYTTESYITAGLKMARQIDAFYTDAPAANAGSGIATYVLIGDSNMICANMDPLAVVASNQGSLLGNVGGTERTGQYIWDHLNEQVVLYDVVGVTNSFGSIEQVYGPECTFLKDAYRRTPEGVVVFKYAQGGASLSASLDGTAMQNIRDSWAKFVSAVFRDLGRTVDCRGVFIMLGRNDGLGEPFATTFATLAPGFIDEVRESFTTRADGPDLAVVWMQPSPHADSGAVWGSTVGSASTLAAVRNSVASLPSVRDRVSVILDPGGTYELQRQDLLHYGSEAVFKIGYDAVASIYALNADEGGDSATATAEVPSETATFTVEDGTGLAAANSYCSVAFADTYHDGQGNPSAWLSAASSTKQNALRIATEAIDLAYGNRWEGMRGSSDQALDWPRTGVTDSAGEDVDDDVIPTRVKRATALAALMVIQGEDLMPEKIEAADISSESKTVGPITKSVTYQGGKPKTPVFRKLDRMLETAGLISSSSGWGYAEA